VRFVDWHVLVDDGFGATPEFAWVEQDILDGIAAIRWPPGSADFAIPPGKHLNGVTPIKDAFVEHLKGQGWVPEHARFDAHLDFGNGTLPFAVEWETGNVSSSHRAVNRLALGMQEGRISGGVLVLPTYELYWHLTDRIGNFRELEPYLEIWRGWNGQPGFHYFAIVTVEHDRLDPTAPRILKGTDGRALI
jgi:hypothetical protein